MRETNFALRCSKQSDSQQDHGLKQLPDLESKILPTLMGNPWWLDSQNAKPVGPLISTKFQRSHKSQKRISTKKHFCNDYVLKAVWINCRENEIRICKTVNRALIFVCMVCQWKFEWKTIPSPMHLNLNPQFGKQFQLNTPNFYLYFLANWSKTSYWAYFGYACINGNRNL